MQGTFNHFLLFFILHILIFVNHDALFILYFYILKIEFRRHGKVSNVCSLFCVLHLSHFGAVLYEGGVPPYPPGHLCYGSVSPFFQGEIEGELVLDS